MNITTFTTEDRNVSPFALYALQTELALDRDDTAMDDRSHPFKMILIKRGRGQMIVDLNKRELQAGRIYCIAPGQTRRLVLDPDTDGYVISFTQEFFCLERDNHQVLWNTGLFKYSGISEIEVTSDIQHSIENIVSQMKIEYENYYLLRGEILRGFLKILLIYLSRQLGVPLNQTEEPRNVDLVKRFLNKLDTDFASRKMVADYADELCITPNYLNFVVKKVSGHTASYHIQQRITLEAKRQAAFAVLSMKEIAANLGFDDIGHFSKFFKKAEGRSFTDFKKHVGAYLAM